MEKEMIVLAAVGLKHVGGEAGGKEAIGETKT
jgi:hypothetical protein